MLPDLRSTGCTVESCIQPRSSSSSVHERLAGGATDVLWADDDVYVAQRSGHSDAPGLLFALNNRGDGWGGRWVSCKWKSTRLRPVAWWSGIDKTRPNDQWVHADHRVDVWAPPRGYCVYAPEI